MVDILYDITEVKNESEKRIELFGGGVIDFWSLEDPNPIRGRKYKRIVIDEAEVVRNLKDAWMRVLRPTLTDLHGDAWFLSTPQFGSTYFKGLARITSPNWASWVFTSYDNPFIDPAEIDEARQQLDEAVFRCEYLAEDVTLAINKFIYRQEDIKIVAGLQPIDNLPILLAFDFNVEPIVALSGQVDPQMKEVRILDEFRLLNSDIDELCQRIKIAYLNRMLMVTGDASGQNRTALKRDLNYYKEIKRVLQLSMGQFKIPLSNPPIKSTRTLCNALLARHPKYLFSDRVPYLMLDINETEVDENGGIAEDKDKHKGHLFAAWRYFNWTFLNKFLNLKLYDSNIW